MNSYTEGYPKDMEFWGRVLNQGPATEATELLRLRKTGRLFEIQNWIAAGNSTSVPADSKTTPLEVAPDTGFHSLVELLVRNEPSQDLKNRALQQAVSLKRRDFIELFYWAKKAAGKPVPKRPPLPDLFT